MKAIRVLSIVSIVVAVALGSHAQDPLTNGLVAYYPFNGDANDGSENGNNGVATNATLDTDRFGASDSAYNFNGQHAQIIVNDNPALRSLTSNYTFNAWARFASAPSIDSCMLIKSAGAGAQRKWIFWRHVQASPLGVGALLFRPSDGQHQWNNNYPFTSNRWYMLTFSAWGTNCAIAVDGVVVSVQAGNMTLPDTTGLPLSIGGAEPGGNQWFNGSLDDVRIYNRALSANEIQQLHTTESAPPTPPVSSDGIIYVANQGSGNVRTFALTNGADLGLFATNIAAAHGIALDAAGNVYVASLTDNYIRRFSPSGVDLGIFAANGKNPSPADLIGWWPAEGNAADVTGNHSGIITTQFTGSVSFSPGKVGTAFDFSGTNFVEIQPFPLTNFTIECWVNQRTRVPVTPNSSWGCFLISDEVCGVRDDWHLGLLNGGQLLFHIGDGAGGVDYQFPSTNTIPLNTYVHVAVTRSTVTGKIELYINGVLDSMFNAPHNRVVGMANPDCDIYPNTIGIGNIRRHAALGVSNNFDGLIDEPAIYNRALSAAEIAAIYNASSEAISSPRSIVFDTGGNLYVANAGNNTVRRYSPGGADLGNFISNGLAGPTGMAFDAAGNLYVANYDLNQVKKFAPNGTSLGTAISAGLNQPVGIAVLPNDGGFYVANDFASSIIRYDANGTIVSNLTSGASGRLFYLASDAEGNLYVTRVTGNAVRKFSPTGQDLGDIATTGMDIPAGIAIRQSVVTNPPVVIIAQPPNQQRTVGENASFSVVAGGTQPLFYQWRLNETNLVNGGRISGATSAQLVISNVLLSDAGAYSVVVSNSVNSVASSNATLTVIAPPALVSVVNTTNAAGGLVSVPIRLVANGNENALGFSLTIGTQPLPAVLTFDSVVLGSNAVGASLLVNTNQLGSRRIGVAIALPAGNTFAAGTQEVVQVRFQSGVLLGSNNRIISLTFGDLPTVRQLVSTNASILPATYANASVTLMPSDIEGDSVPRPSGDRVAGITDWVQIGRFVALLDTPAAGGEFQRADCAPKEVLGDGQIKVTDWVQAGRYAAGLDPLRAVGGPTSPSLFLLRHNEAGGASNERNLRTLGSSVYPGQTISVPVVLESQGDENALSFSVAFNPAVFSYAGLTPGSDEMTLSTNVNTSQIASGKLGIVVGLSANNTFASGPRELLKVNLEVLPTVVPGSYPIGLGDLPVLRGISNPGAGELTSTYTAGALSVALPSLQIARSGPNIKLSWPAAAWDFALQTSSDGSLPGVAWTNIPGVLQTNGGDISITLPLGEHSGFYRLHKP